MDEVAILPEAVPGAVVDLALVVGEHRVEAVLDGLLEGGGTVGQAPRRRRRQWSGCTPAWRRAAGSWLPAAAMATVSGLAGKAAEAKRVSSLVRATPIGRAEAGLRVLIGGVKAVTVGVVEAHVHLRCVRRPQPRDELCIGTSSVLDFKPGGERLPEVLHADSEPAAEIACIGEAGRARAGIGIHPGALRSSPLDNGEAVGSWLDELEVVPDGVLAEYGVGSHGLASFLRQVAATRLERFGPQPTIGAGETDGAIQRLVAHRNVDL